MKDTQQFHRTDAIRSYRIFDEDLRQSPESWVLFGAFQSHLPHLIPDGLLHGDAVVWSLWDGYLTEPSGQKLSALLADAAIPLIHHHTSGHASPTELRRLVTAINPVVVVPIHTDAPHRYAETLGREPMQHADGTWWTV